jgi:hypothetical protein
MAVPEVGDGFEEHAIDDRPIARRSRLLREETLSARRSFVLLPGNVEREFLESRLQSRGSGLHRGRRIALDRPRSKAKIEGSPKGRSIAGRARGSRT